MIYYLAVNPSNYRKALKEVLGNSFTKTVKLISYNHFLNRRKLRAGTYIFADIERLSIPLAQRAAAYWRELENSGLRVRLYNHPLKVSRRFELLRSLHDKRCQQWNVYRLTDLRWPVRYPVFLRRENDHNGPITGLIPNRQELEHEIKALTERGYSREDIIITEYCDSKDRYGIYRKYGAFFIGGKIIRRHILFRDSWMVKTSNVKSEQLLREEMDYLMSSAHEDAIRKVFELARIDHGRIDYGMLDGKMQVWEINTHPYMVRMMKKGDSRNQVIKHFYGEYLKAMEEIDLPSQATFRPRVKRRTIPFSRRLLKKVGKLIKGI